MTFKIVRDVICKLLATVLCYVENVKPEMKMINKYVTPYNAADWKNIAKELDVNPKLLHAIDDDYFYDHNY